MAAREYLLRGRTGLARLATGRRLMSATRATPAQLPAAVPARLPWRHPSLQQQPAATHAHSHHRRALHGAVPGLTDTKGGDKDAETVEAEDIVDEAASAPDTPPPPPPPPADPEPTVAGPAKAHTFQAETKRLLEIVAGSLYSEREVFVRELISNASDALEKLRHEQLLGNAPTSDPPLEIRITTDAEKGTLTIQDTGIGMSEEDLNNNLGTIARSGSKAFVENLESNSNSARESIIGQFGVGFYSAFMVSDATTVYTHSATETGDEGFCWTSAGAGEYEVAPAKGVTRGTKIVLQLKEDAKDFADKGHLRSIVQKYSNFVACPIYIDGEQVNTMRALWLEDASSVTDEEHAEFYRFISKSFDEPSYHFHFTSDAPLQINSLFYFPKMDTEKFGFGRMEPAVALYCRKVLITAKAEKLLPDWLRFVRGVVDSEDIPMNLSRELLQDNLLVGKLGKVIAGRVVSFLKTQAKKDPEKFQGFYKEFGNFIREGVYSDNQNSAEIIKLMLFESSKEEAGKMVNLEGYADRMGPDQKHIYFLAAPSREAALNSPYLEALTKSDIEVLFTYEPLDDIVLGAGGRSFKEKRIVSANSSEAGDDIQAMPTDQSAGALSADDEKVLVSMFSDALGKDRVKDVKVSKRLVDAPAIVTDFQSPHQRRMMKMMNQNAPGMLDTPVLEVNPGHALIQGLYRASFEDKALARLLTEQVFANAMSTAGLMDQPEEMVPRIQDIMAAALGKQQPTPSTEGTTDTNATAAEQPKAE